MKSSFTSFALVLAACATPDGPTMPPGTHVLTVIGGGYAYCADGRACPLETLCLDNSYCVQHAATTRFEPPGRSCGQTGQCYADGETVRVEIVGGHTSSCRELACRVTPDAGTGLSCDITLVMDIDYTVSVGCR